MADDWRIERLWSLRCENGEERQVATSDLCGFQAICLLGAGGLGKSFELKRLREFDALSGASCFIDLGLAITESRLERSLQQLNVMPDDTVYLDSLDEAMVSVTAAIGILVDWLDKLETKPRLRIACRSAVWPSVIRKAIGDRYKGSQVADAELLPLREDEIRRIVGYEGLPADEFIAAVQSRAVHLLARQPLTLRLLIDQFRRSGALSGSRTELMEDGIRRMCVESRDRHELRGFGFNSIPVSKLIDAAEWLATLSVTSGVDLIDRSDDQLTSTTLNPSVLSQLPGPELTHAPMQWLSELAHLQLFQGDGEGRFRFLHRQFAEFLAGRRISRLPLIAARQLLASDSGWQYGVAGPLYETASVASSFNSEIASWVAERDPEVFGRSSVADDSLRAKALDSLIARFRHHVLTSAQISRDDFAFDGLKHSDADQVIASILQERGQDLEDVHALAIELGESWNLIGLSDDLANVALDLSLPIRTRVDAAYAVLRMGDSIVRGRLIGLVNDVEGDSDEDLRGVALRCNWPDNLGHSHLLRLLSPPKRNSYYGAYAAFLHQVAESGFTASSARLQGLRWARGMLTQREPAIQQISANIVLAAISHLYDLNVCEEIVSYFVAAGDQFTLPFRACSNDDTSHIRDTENLLSDSPQVRRKLLEEFSKVNKEPHVLQHAVSLVPGLVLLGDFEWLLESASDESREMDQRKRFAHLANWLPWHDKPGPICSWLERRHIGPIRDVFGIPDHIPLGGDLAKQLRENHSRTQRHLEESQPEELLPPPSERLEICLTQCESDPQLFGRLAQELTLSQECEVYEFQRVISESHGWRRANANQRRRIVTAAKRYLETAWDVAEKCRSEPLNSILGDGSMPATFLLQTIEPDWLSARPLPWWRQGGWYILRELRFDIEGESQDTKAAIFDLLCARAPDEVSSELEQLSKRDDGTRLLSDLLDEAPKAGSRILVAAALRLLTDKGLFGDTLSLLMSFALKRANGQAVPICLHLLQVTTTQRDEDFATRAAVALLEHGGQNVWPELIGFFDQYPLLAKKAIGRWAHRESHSVMAFSRLGPLNTGELVCRMLRLFSLRDEHRSGSFYYTEDDAANDLRDRLLNWLGEQTHPDAILALRQLEEEFAQEYAWLRHLRARSERKRRLTEWSPIPLESTANIVADHGKGLIRSGQDVVDGIQLALERYDYRLQSGRPPEVEDLWNTAQGQISPKDEERISEKVMAAIEAGFKTYAVTANREVQLRRRLLSRSLGGAPGCESDVLVSIPARGASQGESIRVVVEIKRSCNAEAKNGMQVQLVDRYLKECGTDWGVFVVAYFNLPNTNDLVASHRPKWQSIDACRADLKAQADRIRVESGGHTFVLPFVLDARLV